MAHSTNVPPLTSRSPDPEPAARSKLSLYIFLRLSHARLHGTIRGPRTHSVQDSAFTVRSLQQQTAVSLLDAPASTLVSLNVTVHCVAVLLLGRFNGMPGYKLVSELTCTGMSVPNGASSMALAILAV